MEKEEKDFELSTEEGISNKVPFRVKSGKFLGDSVELEISDDVKNVNYSDIEYMCAGVIKDKTISATPPKTGIGKMLNTLFSKDGSKEEENSHVIKTFYLLDIYIKDQTVPFRINGGFVNYKSFLNKIGYISLENFKMLLKEFAYRAKDSRFNKTICSFISKSPIKKFYISELEFLIEASEERKKIEAQHSWNDLFENGNLNLDEENKVANKIEEIMSEE